MFLHKNSIDLESDFFSPYIALPDGQWLDNTL